MSYANTLTGIRGVYYIKQGAPLTPYADYGMLYEDTARDLLFTDDLGVTTNLTSGGSVVGTPYDVMRYDAGGFAGDSGVQLGADSNFNPVSISLTSTASQPAHSNVIWVDSGSSTLKFNAVPILTTPITDTALFIVDAVDPTKRMGFDVGGAAGTTTTLVTAATSNRAVNIPDANDTLVGKNTTDVLTNKTLTAPVIATIVNSGTLTLPTSTDTLVGKNTTDVLTNKTLTLPVISSIVNSGTLTLPTSTDTLVGLATSDVLTNKTIIASSNNVAANSLKTTGAVVNVSASAAPTLTGMSLVTTSATTATWQSVAAGFTGTAYNAVNFSSGGLPTDSGIQLRLNNTNTNLSIGSSTTANNSIIIGGSTSSTGSIAIGISSDAPIGSTTIGHNAGNTTSVTSVMIGYQAGTGNTGSSNVLVGYESCTTGVALNSSFVGYRAGYECDTTDNVGVGLESLFCAVTSSGSGKNTAVGSNSMHECSSGSSNTCVGYSSGINISTGSTNVMMGNLSGTTITTGGNNVLIGTQTIDTGGSAVTGCTVVGYRAGQSLGSAGTVTNTVCVGQSCGVTVGSNAAGSSFNTLIGDLIASSTGGAHTLNTIIGGNCATGITSGASNTIVGTGAGPAITSGSNNLVLGRSAGASLSTGSSNIIIAGTANGNNVLSTGSGNIIISNDVTVVAAAANTIQIGNTTSVSCIIKGINAGSVDNSVQATSTGVLTTNTSTPFGRIQTGSVTQSTTLNTYVAVVPTSQTAVGSPGITFVTTTATLGQLKYLGPSTRQLFMTYNASWIGAKDLEFAFAQGGTVRYSVRQTGSGAANYNNISMCYWMDAVAVNDIITVQVQNRTDSANITINTQCFTVGLGY